MDIYRVVADGVEVFRYTEFQRAGHSGVRESGQSGLIDEHAGMSAHAMAVVKVVREDGTVAAEMRRQ